MPLNCSSSNSFLSNKYEQKRENFLLKNRHNLIERDLRIFNETIDNQMKIEIFKNDIYKIKLKENLKKFDKFKKFQFETEYELKCKHLRNALSACQTTKLNNQNTYYNHDQNKRRNEVDKVDENLLNNSKFYQRATTCIRKELFSTFQVPNDLVQAYGIIDEIDEKESISTYNSLASLSSSSLESFITNENTNILNNKTGRKMQQEFKFSENDKNNIDSIINNRLSLVLSGKSNDYYIYKFNQNGSFINNIRQPIIKPALLTVDYKKKTMENVKEILYKREKGKINENQKRVQKFLSEIEF